MKTPFETALHLAKGHTVDRKDLHEVERVKLHLRVIITNARAVLKQLKDVK